MILFYNVSNVLRDDNISLHAVLLLLWRTALCIVLFTQSRPATIYAQRSANSIASCSAFCRIIYSNAIATSAKGKIVTSGKRKTSFVFVCPRLVRI